MPPLLLALTAYLTVLLPILALVFAVRRRTAGAARRLADVGRFREALLVGVANGELAGAAKPAGRGGERALRLRFEQTNLGRRLLPQAERDLEQTPWALSAFAYVSLRAGLPLVAAAIAWLFFASPVPTLAAAIIVHSVLHGVVGMQIGRYRATIGRQTEAVIDLLVSHLRAGQSLVQALNALAEEAPAPSREEFQRVSRELALGTPVSEALRRLEARVPVTPVSLLVSALNLHHRIGGDLPLLLRIAADTVHDQIRLQDELAASSAGQLLSGYVVVALPIILFLALLLIDRPYMSGLLQPGWNLLLWLGGGLEIVGLLLIRSFTRVQI